MKITKDTGTFPLEQPLPMASLPSAGHTADSLTEVLECTASQLTHTHTCWTKILWDEITSLCSEISFTDTSSMRTHLLFLCHFIPQWAGEILNFPVREFLWWSWLGGEEEEEEETLPRRRSPLYPDVFIHFSPAMLPVIQDDASRSFPLISELLTHEEISASCPNLSHGSQPRERICCPSLLGRSPRRLHWRLVTFKTMGRLPAKLPSRRIRNR